MEEKNNLRENFFFPQNEGNLVFIWLLVFPPSEKGWHGGEEMPFSVHETTIQALDRGKTKSILFLYRHI